MYLFDDSLLALLVTSSASLYDILYRFIIRDSSDPAEEMLNGVVEDQVLVSEQEVDGIELRDFVGETDARLTDAMFLPLNVALPFGSLPLPTLTGIIGTAWSFSSSEKQVCEESSCVLETVCSVVSKELLVCRW